MSKASVEELIQSAAHLSDDEKLDLAQRLIERARRHGEPRSVVDLNALAGTLKLEEDPLAIQERMRREWQ